METVKRLLFDTGNFRHWVGWCNCRKGYNTGGVCTCARCPVCVQPTAGSAKVCDRHPRLHKYLAEVQKRNGWAFPIVQVSAAGKRLEECKATGCPHELWQRERVIKGRIIKGKKTIIVPYWSVLIFYFGFLYRQSIYLTLAQRRAMLTMGVYNLQKLDEFLMAVDTVNKAGGDAAKTFIRQQWKTHLRIAQEESSDAKDLHAGAVGDGAHGSKIP